MAEFWPGETRIAALRIPVRRGPLHGFEWGESLTFSAPPSGGVATDPRAETFSLSLPHAAARPWAPAHVRAKRISGSDVEISWVRCARIGGDAWGPGDPPLGAPSEGYVLEILDGAGVLKRSVNVSTQGYLYGAVDQTADFGAPPALLRLRVAQIGENGAAGLNKELTITL